MPDEVKRQGAVKRVMRRGYNLFASAHNTTLAQVMIITLLSLIVLVNLASRLPA